MKRRVGGYTIIEVMIVLAVSGGLLVSAIVMLGGKQAQTQSSESVHLLDSSLEAMSREVASGFYSSGISCTAPNIAGPVSLGVGGTPGGNTGCIFIGRVLNMGPTAGTYVNIVGRQFKVNTTDDISNLSEAGANTVIQDASPYSYPYSLTITKIVNKNNTADEYNALAFLIELAGGGSSSNPVTGSRGIELYGIQGAVAGHTGGAVVNVGGLVKLQDGAIICIKTADGKLAEITIGASGNQYSTNVLIDNGVDNAVC